MTAALALIAVAGAFGLVVGRGRATAPSVAVGIERASASGFPARALLPVIWTNSPIDPNCVVSSVQNLASSRLSPLPTAFPTAASQVTTQIPLPASGTSAVPTVDSVSQLYVNDNCISCTPPSGSGAPAPTAYKVQANLSPKSDWITFVGEMESHPAFAGSTADVSYEEHNGYWGDVWVVSPDGAHWYNLTNLAVPATGQLAGSLSAHLSPDESKLVWASLVGGPSQGLGNWRFMLADFVVNNGVPSLQNVRDLTPPNSSFNELHDWSPDGSTVVLTSDSGLPYSYGADDWTYNLNTGALVDITKQSLYWEEHAYYSPSGRKILMAEQAPNSALLPQDATMPYDQWRPLLRTEAWVMNPDGSQPMQLTGLNVSAPVGTPDPELSTSTFSTVFGMEWNTTGTQVIVPQNVLNGSTGTATNVALWLITFQGTCG